MASHWRAPYPMAHQVVVIGLHVIHSVLYNILILLYSSLSFNLPQSLTWDATQKHVALNVQQVIVELLPLPESVPPISHRVNFCHFLFFSYLWPLMIVDNYCFAIPTNSLIDAFVCSEFINNMITCKRIKIILLELIL